MDDKIILIVFALLGVILVLNVFKFIIDFFSNRREYVEVREVRNEVNQKVKPYLSSLEKKFEQDKESGDKFGAYVYKLVKDKFSSKNEKLVEREVCRCCSEYEKAECKEDFCLEGAGISCNKKQ